MAASPMKAIQANIKTTLETILVANGNKTNLGQLVEEVTHDEGEDRKDARPYSSVQPYTDPEVQYLPISNEIRVKQKFLIASHHYNLTDVVGELADAEDDIIAAMHTDLSRGGNAIWTKLVDKASTAGLIDRPPFGSLWLVFEVLYYRTRGQT